MSYKIKVDYFRESGKYHASGEFETEREHMFELFKDFSNMLKEGKRPGLVDGHSGLTAVLDCSEHPNGYPALFAGEA